MTLRDDELSRAATRAHDNLIATLASMFEDGGYMPQKLSEAWYTYSDAVATMQNERMAEVQRRQDEWRVTPVHYISSPGARQTLCGLRTDDRGVGYGWVGRDYEFYTRRVANGGAVCEACNVVIKEGL